MMITCLSRALITSTESPSQARFCAVRYSIAKWMPLSSRPGTRRSRGSVDPPFAERALDDRRFRGLDGDRRVVDPEHARPLARRRTQPAGEFGEVVRRVQPIDCGAPAIAVHEIVPVGNQVAERTALMAERNPAIHTPRRLILQRRFRVRQRDL